MRMEIKAYDNLPDKFLRQHRQYEIGGTDSGGVPVAKVRYPLIADYFAELGIIDNGQLHAAVHFNYIRQVALSAIDATTSQVFDRLMTGSALGRALEQDIEQPQEADEFRRVVRDLLPAHYEYVKMSVNHWDGKATPANSSALYKLGDKIDRALSALEAILTIGGLGR